MKNNSELKNDKMPITETITDMAGELSSYFDGIPAPLKKGFWKAVNHLSTAWLEGKAIEVRAASEAKASLRKAVAVKIAESGTVPDEYIQLAMEKHASKIVGKKLNLDKILDKTRVFLETEKVDNIACEPEEISTDWLNSFENIAENMSSEEMQLRFAKILAGEIKKPSSYSIKSIRTLSEIDDVTAKLFVNFCSCCIVKKIPHINFFDGKLITLSNEGLGQNSMEEYGFGYNQLVKLQEYGLIGSELSTNLNYADTIIVPSLNKLGTPLYYLDKAWGLRQTGDDNPAQLKEFKLSGVSLTSTGKELYKIVDLVPQDYHFEALKKFLEGKNLKLETVNII